MKRAERRDFTCFHVAFFPAPYSYIWTARRLQVHSTVRPAGFRTSEREAPKRLSWAVWQDNQWARYRQPHTARKLAKRQGLAQLTLVPSAAPNFHAREAAKTRRARAIATRRPPDSNPNPKISVRGAFKDLCSRTEQGNGRKSPNAAKAPRASGPPPRSPQRALATAPAPP